MRMRIQPIFDSTLQQPAEEAELAIADAPLPRQAAFPRFVETAAEILWIILLVLVIGFFVSKASTISAVFNEAAAAMRRGGEPALHANDAQIQDLELRMTSDERKLSTLERGYAQLKQRHSDLLRAYASLQENRLQPPAGGIAPKAAARSGD
jgi:hypothetical protein